jgi:molybdenum cofactor guanylyltransferase
MRLPMPAAVLAGGASKRMGKSKADLRFGSGTLLQHQIVRLAPLFEEMLVVVKDPPEAALGRARVLLDSTPRQGAVYGVLRALEEVEDRVFVLAVDLPLVTLEVIREISERGLATTAPALVPEADGHLQPLAAVWRRAALPAARERIARGELSLRGLAEEIGAEILPEAAWRRFDPSGNSFANLNTMEDYLALRERA